MHTLAKIKNEYYEKKSYCILIFLVGLTVLLESKKCNNPPPPPPPKPAPSQTTVAKKLVLPIYSENLDPNDPNKKTYRYPAEDGAQEEFPDDCYFTPDDIASIRVQVKYYTYDAAGNITGTVTYSDQTYPSSCIQMWGFYPYININAPDGGWYWVEVEYLFHSCTDCCGQIKAWGTGVTGCPSSPETFFIEQGKPKINAKTFYDEHDQYDDIDFWDEFHMICICDCR